MKALLILKKADPITAENFSKLIQGLTVTTYDEFAKVIEKENYDYIIVQSEYLDDSFDVLDYLLSKGYGTDQIFIFVNPIDIIDLEMIDDD